MSRRDPLNSMSGMPIVARRLRPLGTLATFIAGPAKDQTGHQSAIAWYADHWSMPPPQSDGA
ncbi:MAG: hypothetical protein QOD94_6 [Alphaproteobacteria bacterium]|jgi:hypothetical protein|nr:hypothetical protein [Alphaproteobacteria bacterium]